MKGSENDKPLHDFEGKIIEKLLELHILKVLGEGAFGKVKLASKSLKDFDRFEKKYAIKVYKKANLRKKKTIVRDKNGSFLIFLENHLLKND